MNIMTAEERFVETGSKLPDAQKSQMFGKACFKINGKAFTCFFQDCMVFKLKDEAHTEALALPGAKLFDPSGKNRPMKEWVQVPYEFADKWDSFAKEAYEYVSSTK